MVKVSMRGCFLNKLHIYSVLAAAAERPINQGKPLVSASRAQYFKYKSIQYMQEYFRSRTSFGVDDAQVILDILFMFSSELYIRNYGPALTHVKIASKLLGSLGDSDFEKYVRHGCQASDILLSMETLEAPVLPLDWDPGPFPLDSWKRITTSTRPVGQALLQASLCGLADPDLCSIMADVVPWTRVYQYTAIYSNPSDLQWVNYRGNALMHRLLSLTAIPSEDFKSESVRLALVILIGCVISQIGLLRSGKINAARLYAVLERNNQVSCRKPGEIMLWIMATGYVTAMPGSEEQKWFATRAGWHAKWLGINGCYESLEDLMRKHFFLDIHRPAVKSLFEKFSS